MAVLARRAAVTLACVCWGCATTAPLRTDDPVFAAAEGHLRESDARLGGTGAPSPDEVLFLQGESLFFYRFALARSRGTRSYAAQAAAAFADFAPLTVLSASQGLLDLRLHAYDGAAQLYTTLASAYPRSARRPAALYRLGWACRSTSEDAFPCSPRGAMDALQREYPDSPLAPLARDALRVPMKSLDRATTWSILPGAGQIYVGEVLNGTVRLSVGAAFGALALVPIVAMIRARRFGWFPSALSAVGGIGLQVTYTTAYQDAQRAVLEYNERQEAAFEAAHPDAP